MKDSTRWRIGGVIGWLIIAAPIIAALAWYILVGTYRFAPGAGGLLGGLAVSVSIITVVGVWTALVVWWMNRRWP